MATNDLHHLDFIQTRTLEDMKELEDRLSLLPSPSTSSSEKSKQNDSPQSQHGSIPASPRTIQDMATPSTSRPPTISGTSRPNRRGVYRVFGFRDIPRDPKLMRPTPEQINRRMTARRVKMSEDDEKSKKESATQRAIRDQRIRESSEIDQRRGG